MSDSRKYPHDQATPVAFDWSVFLGLALAVVMVGAIAAYAVRSAGMPNYGECEEQDLPPGEQGVRDFAQWEKPLVAIVLSGQMHGFVDPCGCSEPQYGGLVRRYNFIQSLKDKKWDVVGIDLGELPYPKGGIHKQNLLKYELSIRALGLMNYRAIGIGKHEVLLPLGEGLAQAEDSKRPFPRPIALNLADTAPKEKYHELNVRPYEIIDTTKPKIGVISVMGPALREELEKLEKFLPNEDQLPKALNAFAAAGVEIGVILHHEYPVVDKKLEGYDLTLAFEKARMELAEKCASFCANARAKNPKIPPIQIMMVLSDEPEPPSIMRPLGGKVPTQLVETGHKGRYVGVVGVYKDGKGYRLQYHMEHMSPNWKKDNEITVLMEKYNQELKQTDMLAKFPRTQHINQIMPTNQQGLRATYVGSDRCGDCHTHAFQVWQTKPNKEIGHFKATATLEDPKQRPVGRQFDPECMQCHTTGFKHPGGYNDLVINLAQWPKKPGQAPTDKKIAAHNENLRGVGCETCHGPGSEHVKNPNDMDWLKLMNPYAPSANERKLEEMKARTPQEQLQLKQLFDTRMRVMATNLCMKCHDNENDVNWGQPGKDTADKWLKLIHRTPKNNNGAGINPAKGNGPALVEPPPFQIEIIQDKKK